MKFNLKARFLALSLVLLLLLGSLAFSESEGTRGTRATDPDLSVEDIWFNSTSSRVHCRIVNLGMDYQGLFMLNLTLDGYPYYQELVDWTPGQGVANVTFPQAIMWSTSRIEVEVEIYYHITAIDADLSNNRRSEVWNRELPDLIVRSFYQDPEKGNTVAVIENIGEVECTQFFYVILNIYGQSQPWEMVFDPIPPHGRVKVPFQWVWNRTLYPEAEISISVDFPNDVAEMNNTNNGYFITWRDRSSLYFIEEPNCDSSDETSASIVWETSIPTVAVIEYGMTSKLGKSAETKTPESSGSLVIGSLEPSTQYLYRVLVKDEFGRTVRSELLSFYTDDPDGTMDIAGGFERSSYSINPEVVKIPFSISEKLGLRKVDLYLNGKLIKSNGAMGKGTFKDLTLDMSMKKAGNYALIARVETLTGGEKEFMTTLVVQARPTIRYPIVTFNVSPVPCRGSEYFMARCEDPDGMVNATWYVDSEFAELDVARHPEASYFGPTFTWDSRTVSDGNHNITIEVANHDGNITSVTRTVLVDNILDPPDPDIWVRRGNILRTGTTCTVPLTVSNHGRGTAVDIVVEDWIKGFIPINGDRGTRSDNSLATVWRVVLNVGSLEPEEEVTITYDCIPAIYEDEEWELGAWMTDPFSDEEYTTTANYLRDDHLVEYDKIYGIPTANFDEGYIMQAGALHAISLSSYMVLTVPIRLASAIGWRESDQLLIRAAYLASLKWGVFGFPPRRGGVAPSEEQVLDDLIEWKDMMAPLFDDMGYLMILGEDDVVPTWSFTRVYWDGTAWNDVDGSDQGYSNLNGGDAPELIVGRIIGNDLHEMLTPINTSIYVHEGGLFNDPEGKALLLSGAGSGVQEFHDNMEDLAGQITSTMSDLDVVHKGDAFPILENDFIENDGITGHMAAGDVDGDNLGEVVILNTAMDRVRIFNPDYGGSESFDLVMTDDARVLVGDLIGDAVMDIIIIDQSAGNGWLTILETSGDYRDSWIIPWEPGDPVCMGDIDNDGTDDVIIASEDDGMFYVEGEDGDDITEVNAWFYRSGSRIASADLNDDGWDDIVVCDHVDDEVDVFINDQNMADDSWSRRWTTVPGLDLEDGFSAGSFGVSWGAVRDYAVVIQSDQEGQFTIVWTEWDATAMNWETNAQTNMMTPVRDRCSVYVAEMLGDGFSEEIVVCEGPTTDDLTILDLGNIGDNFRSMVDPHMRGNDLIVYRDHGNEGSWSGLYNSGMVDDLGIASASHRPVVFGSVCLSGRFISTDNTFAHSMLRNGAGVYIGATEVSLRSSNNAAIQMIVDYTEGVPIGQAFRNFERDFLGSPGTLGLSQQEADYWCFEYNLYGDPAFGTTGLPFALYRVIPLYELFTREEANIQIDEPIFRNDSDGKRVSIPGGFQRFEIGNWVMPYMSYQFDIPSGWTIGSVNLENISEWTYYEDLYLPPLEEIKPPSFIPARGPEVIDPDDAWDPAVFHEWSVSYHINGNRTFLLKIYPLQYDGSTLRGRFCSDWRVTVDVVPVPVEIVDLYGPGTTSDPGELVSFGYDLEPIGAGGTVSISHRIETEGGDVVEVLSASLMDVNITTSVVESWDPTGSGDYVFIVEIKDSEGSPVAEYQYPFQVGVVGARISELTADPEVLGAVNDISVSMVIENFGNITLDGKYSITVYDPAMGKIDEISNNISISPGEEITAEADLDLTGAYHESYYIRGHFRSVLSSDSFIISVPRTKEEVGYPVDYSLIIEVEPFPENLIEGGLLWINGTILRNDTKPLPGVAVVVNIMNVSGQEPVITGPNGSFLYVIEYLLPGNWTISIEALVGDWSEEETIPISVAPRSPGDDDDDDVVDDDVVDDDVVDDDVVDDDIVDDDTTDDDVVDDDVADDDDEKETNWGLIAGIIVGVIFLVLVLVFIVVMVRRAREEVMDWDEE